MGTRYLIDSNSVIYYLEGSLPVLGMSFMDDVINDIPNISIVTKIEVLGFKMSKQDARLMGDFVDAANVIGLTDAIADKTIELRKNQKIKLPDAVIAATALFHGLVLISRNLSDFKRIADLKVISPHDM
ncbi:type II toxin-antitoxin system VapC family toxin [Parapedobacter sp. 2B3]|uniref:type II toxin-antitoxin system VapC family toxin n=1 Tax=Parapedobacter sp. 2B3 TaxID=3342381 RepID=UPI0035B600AB